MGHEEEQEVQENAKAFGPNNWKNRLGILEMEQRERILQNELGGVMDLNLSCWVFVFFRN